MSVFPQSDGSLTYFCSALTLRHRSRTSALHQNLCSSSDQLVYITTSGLHQNLLVCIKSSCFIRTFWSLSNYLVSSEPVVLIRTSGLHHNLWSSSEHFGHYQIILFRQNLWSLSQCLVFVRSSALHHNLWSSSDHLVFIRSSGLYQIICSTCKDVGSRWWGQKGIPGCQLIFTLRSWPSA